MLIVWFWILFEHREEIFLVCENDFYVFNTDMFFQMIGESRFQNVSKFFFKFLQK